MYRVGDSQGVSKLFSERRRGAGCAAELRDSAGATLPACCTHGRRLLCLRSIPVTLDRKHSSGQCVPIFLYRVDCLTSTKQLVLL